MAVTNIPNVQNWTVTPQNGQAGYFGLMNTWLGQSTLVIASLQTAIAAQNIANSEINALAIQTENNAIIATGLANFKGAWSGATTYSKGQSVESTTGSKIYYTSKVDSNLNHAVTDTNYWLYNPINDKLDEDFSLLTDKATPSDTDIFAIHEVGGLFKKLSWANLKATIVSSFGAMIDTLTAKTTVVANDLIVIADSAGSNTSKKVTLANLKNFISPASSEAVAGIIEIATSTEAQAGTDDLRAVTPLKLFNSLKGSNQSLSINGYQKLHGGLIIQWGSAIISASTGAYLFYPIVFPNGSLQVAISHEQVVGSGNIAIVQFGNDKIYLNNQFSGSITARYIAIGY